MPHKKTNFFDDTIMNSRRNFLKMGFGATSLFTMVSCASLDERTVPQSNKTTNKHPLCLDYGKSFICILAKGIL